MTLCSAVLGSWRLTTAAEMHGGKVIKVIIVNGKMIMRLPSTGAKVIKMLTYMEMGDTSDRYDIFDTNWL